MRIHWARPRRSAVSRVAGSLGCLALGLVLATVTPCLAGRDFNVLEAASLDSSGAIELFGTDDARGPQTPIPFDQVLAEALDNAAPPQFSLDSDFSQFTAQVLAGKSMEDLFHSAPGKLSPFGKATLEALRIPLPEDEEVDLTALLLRQAGFTQAAELHEAIPAGSARPTAATRTRWVQILGLSDEFRRYLDVTKNRPQDRHVAADRFYISFLTRLARSMAPHAPRLMPLYRDERDAGSAPDRAFGKAQVLFLQAYAELSVKAVSILLDRHQLAAVVLDAPALKEAFGVSPISRPRFVNLAPGSQLARILLEGDYALKTLPLDRSLTEIGGFRTFPEWAQTTIGPSGLGSVKTNRLWISLEGARVEIRESEDGTIASFGKVQMKIESRSKGADEDWSAERQDRQTQGYADLLSQHFDALAQRVPALHQLREAAKVVALAKWIRGKDVQPRLTYEPAAWSAPETVDGFLAMVPSFKAGKLYWGVLPSGGVDFDFEIVVTKDSSLTLDSLRRRAAGQESIDALRRDAVRRQLERQQHELERTMELESRLQIDPSSASLSLHLEETDRSQVAALLDSAEGLGRAAVALASLSEEIRALPPERRGPFMEALEEASPRPPMAAVDRLQTHVPALETAVARLRSSGADGREALASGQPYLALVEAVESWVEALGTVNRDRPEALAQIAGSAESLHAFFFEALSALVALSLYREHTLTLEALRPSAGNPAGALPAVRQVRERQASRLDELRRDGASPGS